MNFRETKDAYIIENLPFFCGVTLGFTRPSLDGLNIKDDIKKVFNKEPSLSFAYLRQMHSSIVHDIKQQGRYNGDGLITDRKKLILVIKTADCLPLFIIDKKNLKVGIFHIGWQGAKKGILDNINFDFTSSYVVIGVGLRKCCYQVGEEFLKIKMFSPFIAKRKNTLYFDIVSFVRNTLLEKRVASDNFFDVDICSFCSKYNFFSWRRNKTIKRTLSFITIR